MTVSYTKRAAAISIWAYHSVLNAMLTAVTIVVVLAGSRLIRWNHGDSGFDYLPFVHSEFYRAGEEAD